MTIKNTTKFQPKTLEGINRASKFKNEKYKKFKLIYNLVGLIFLMLFVRYMVMFLVKDDTSDVFLTVFYAVAAVVFLFIGMYWIDRDNRHRFNNLYKNMIGVEFKYEIDSEDIIVEDTDKDTDNLKWVDVTKVEKDLDYVYLFFDNDNCLALDNNGYTSGTKDDLLALSEAIFATRLEEERDGKKDADTININEESIDKSYVTDLDIDNEEHQASEDK